MACSQCMAAYAAACSSHRTADRTAKFCRDPVLHLTFEHRARVRRGECTFQNS
jgi:hypothetical protein